MAMLTKEVLQKIAPHKDKFLAIHPNRETKNDTSFVYDTEAYDEEGNPKDTESGLPIITIPQIPKYTDAQWLNEYVKRHLIAQIKRGEEVLAKRALEISDVDLGE